ncbi:tyrosine-protein kinase ABL1 [Nilaparvata lugens]|uniref:tyrosine-protein kinase ABL1 n=1 Tax=Nilaparvata lugens TaxID=108931 RepID=UPI00193D5390|nr:tyrosine-protein kinase ABL1 [Nilaparvata lugens]XP_022190784.2 tyrosine-protein kinase ABL1 [Nilaparvata lugens]XP_039279169.1 tyrosine-protein kinase ABL1 [Nilaparvata lugens]
MCLHLCILASLIKNLIGRLVDEIADCFAAVKAFIYYRLCCCCCKDDVDDTAPNENATNNSDAWQHAQQGDKNNSNVDSLLLSLRRYHWFHKVDRETAHRMVRSGGQGCFMVRPSESGQSPIALTVWHEGRPYNVFIRIRDDNCVALGSAKYHEMVFPNVESLIRYHHVEELILMSNKRKAGKTLLICTPMKSRFEDV